MDIEKLRNNQKDLAGKKFGRWTVIEFSGKSKYWVCKCDCGTIRNINISNLRSGRSESCGCLRIDVLKAISKYRNPISLLCTASKHPLYPMWRAMIDRCNNPDNRAYKYYGGRGITVCKEWLNFDTFIEDMGPRPEGLTIDRINNKGNYEKSNCRWATYKEQANNRTHWSEKIFNLGSLNII